MKYAFPETADFEYALSSLTRKKPYDLEGFEIIQIYKEQEQINHVGKQIKKSAKYLYYKANANIQFNTIVNRVTKILSAQNHVSNDSISRVVLYYYSFIPRNINAVEKLNLILSWNTTADLNQYIVYPFLNFFNFNLTIDDFQMSTFDHLKFKGYCEKFKTDFYDLYGERLINSLCIKRKFFKINLLHFIKITELNVKYTVELNEVAWLYYQELSKYYVKDFIFNFHNNQNLMTFLNGDYIDINEWKTLSPWQINIFLNIGKNKKDGWIIPENTQPYIDFANSDGRYHELKSTLTSKYGINRISQINQNATIEKYIAFCATAKRHVIQGRISEGYLHYVIALDLVFGEKDNSTNSITTKVAMCTFKQLNQTYQSTSKTLKKIYDKRSKYVHCGDKINLADLETLEHINKIIFHVLVRNNTNEWDIKKWLKRINILISKEEAEVLITEQEFIEIGIE